MPSFHPTDDVLMDYAAGLTSEATGLLVATHLALCPDCRAKVRGYEALGGALVEELDPVSVGIDADDLLDRIGAVAGPSVASPSAQSIRVPAPASRVRPADRVRPAAPIVPQPLRGYLEQRGAIAGASGRLDTLPWQRFNRSLAEIPLDVQGGRAKLLRIAAGQAMPKHTHSGSELTLVLQGGFQDAAGHYLRGDVALADDTVEHQPIADTDGDCICLAIVEGDLRLTGPVGRILNLFVRF